MKSLKEIVKNPYVDMIIFVFIDVFIGYILMNLYTFIRYDVFVSLIAFPIIFIVTAPVGLIFIAIDQYYKKKTIKDIEKSIDTIDEPFKSELIEMLKLKKK